MKNFDSYLEEIKRARDVQIGQIIKTRSKRYIAEDYGGITGRCSSCAFIKRKMMCRKYRCVYWKDGQLKVINFKELKDEQDD